MHSKQHHVTLSQLSCAPTIGQRTCVEEAIVAVTDYTCHLCRVSTYEKLKKKSHDNSLK